MNILSTQSIFNGGLNLWTIMGMLLILSSISWLMNYWISRPEKGKFKGKIKLFVISAIAFVSGIVTLILGIIQAMPVLLQ